MKCLKFQVHGRVQGVFYRASTVEFVKNENLNITGYVKNLANGDVEVLAQGVESELDKLYEWLNSGPIMAKVISVKVDNIDVFTEYVDFKVVY